MASAARRKLTYVEYLDLEIATGIKHEFADGEAYAMAGGSIAHADLIVAVTTGLQLALRGRPCRPSGSEQRLRVPLHNRSYYADASVFCGVRERDELDRDALVNPTVLVEVLSPTTEAFDRGRKFEHYRSLPSLREYVLVATDHVHVDVFRRQGDGTWALASYGAGDTFTLASIDVRLSVEEIYEGIEPDPPS